MVTQVGMNKKGNKMARHTSDQTTYKILNSGAWVRMSLKKHESKETLHNNSARRRQKRL
jgi:hypothetical protein